MFSLRVAKSTPNFWLGKSLKGGIYTYTYASASYYHDVMFISCQYVGKQRDESVLQVAVCVNTLTLCPTHMRQAIYGPIYSGIYGWLSKNDHVL
jgi:hypothetical protein